MEDFEAVNIIVTDTVTASKFHGNISAPVVKAGAVVATSNVFGENFFGNVSAPVINTDDVIATGNIVANHFSGDLTATAINTWAIAASGEISASNFVGDGSLLTNVSGVKYDRIPVVSTDGYDLFDAPILGTTAVTVGEDKSTIVLPANKKYKVSLYGTGLQNVSMTESENYLKMSSNVVSFFTTNGTTFPVFNSAGTGHGLVINPCDSFIITGDEPVQIQYGSKSHVTEQEKSYVEIYEQY